MADEYGYPTASQLDAITQFSGPMGEFMTTAEQAWPDPWGTWHQFDIDGDRPGTLWSLATHGWSGCESVIAAIDRTMFALATWRSSTRGGLHEYMLPATLRDAAMRPLLPRPSDRVPWSLGPWERLAAADAAGADIAPDRAGSLADR